MTDSYRVWSTRDVVWSPDRAGNWLFHCHITFHVVPEARLDYRPTDEHQTHSTAPMAHMAGLALGVTVAPGRATTPAPTRVRKLALYVDQGGPRGRAPSTFSYILQNGPKAPAADSMQRIGSTLFLTRGERSDITVHNRSKQAGGIHWHGIELESWSDGVVGWSSKGAAMAPLIVPVAPSRPLADAASRHVHVPHPHERCRAGHRRRRSARSSSSSRGSVSIRAATISSRTGTGSTTTPTICRTCSSTATRFPIRPGRWRSA
ncbi:MAG: multicopper oxidase domain-containing protein [Gemmatimonadetes bacterium]|nr:multicopper oxidase domain-containing protein [Gemmatimonadota bacterium]